MRKPEAVWGNLDSNPKSIVYELYGPRSLLRALRQPQCQPRGEGFWGRSDRHVCTCTPSCKELLQVRGDFRTPGPRGGAPTPEAALRAAPSWGPVSLSTLFLVTPHVTCLPRQLCFYPVLARQLCPVSSHLRVLPDLPGPRSGGFAHEARGGLCLRHAAPGIRVGTFVGRETVTELSWLRSIALWAREAINHFNRRAGLESSSPFPFFSFFFFQHETVPAAQ